MTIARRIALFLLGVILLAAGMLFFTMMCGSNAHVAGALLGGLGAIVLAVRRRATRVLWPTVAGAALGSVAGAAMEYLGSSDCAGLFNAIGAGVCIGGGLGAAVDAVRGRPRTAVPDEQA